jgi:hypothetical protein
MRLAARIAAFLLVAVPAAAQAADDLFQKTGADSLNGFLAATDPLYVKECGGCHFAYSPGLLPARSWELQMSRMERHFGESVTLSPAAREAITRYLVDNAADRSPYAGSKIFMRRLEADSTPYRFSDVWHYREMHRIIREVIDLKPRIKIRRLTNCDGCHQYAKEGSFGHSELLIPGLTPSYRP